jgi:hypothetical protein
MHNSPLREQPREQRAGVIPLKDESSLLDWLYATGRLISRDQQEPEFLDVDEEGVTDFLDSDDVGDIYDDDDDIDMEIDEEA